MKVVAGEHGLAVVVEEALLQVAIMKSSEAGHALAVDAIGRRTSNQVPIALARTWPLRFRVLRCVMLQANALRGVDIRRRRQYCDSGFG